MTANKFLVGVRGDKVVFSGLLIPREISKEDALNLAAWIVALADLKGEFPKLLEQVQNT